MIQQSPSPVGSGFLICSGIRFGNLKYFIISDDPWDLQGSVTQCMICFFCECYLWWMLVLGLKPHVCTVMSVVRVPLGVSVGTMVDWTGLKDRPISPLAWLEKFSRLFVETPR